MEKMFSYIQIIFSRTYNIVAIPKTTVVADSLLGGKTKDPGRRLLATLPDNKSPIANKQ
jgi:hypothetical protein